MNITMGQTASDPGPMPPAGHSYYSTTPTWIDDLIKGVTDLGTTAMNVFGTQPAPTPTPAPGGVIVTQPAPQRAGMDPTTLAIIGIPAALIGIALLRGGRR